MAVLLAIAIAVITSVVAKKTVGEPEAEPEGEPEDYFCCRDLKTKLLRSQVCDERKDCPLNESGGGGEDEEDCDHHEGSAPAEVLPELDWCKSNASKSLNTRSGPDAVHSEPASSVIGPG